MLFTNKMIHNFLSLYVVSRIGIVFLDFGVRKIVKMYEKKQTHKNIYKLSFVDKICLFINGIQETLFLWNLFMLAKNIPIFQTKSFMIGFPFIFLLDDLFYGTFHKMLHFKRIYPWIHKRHHTIAEPYAGYCHASMEHPLEMLGGLLIHYFVLNILHAIGCLDLISMTTHLLLKAILSIANHTGTGVDTWIFSNVTHFKHHKYRNCYFTQYNKLDFLIEWNSRKTNKFLKDS